MPDIHVGSSGWSYPTWRPGFYPAGLDPKEFLGFYAQRFSTVELNTTGYRPPAEEQFVRWAAQAPDGFEFSPKLPGHWLGASAAKPPLPGRRRAAAGGPGRPRGLDVFESRVRLLGDRLGPVRISLKSKRDDGALELLLGSLDPSLRLAFDLEHPSWDGVEERLAQAGAVRVNDLDHAAPFRFLRLREPPYDDAALRELADRIRPIAEPVYVYFRHEDEPTAPAYALRLLELLG
jgi:uncharacterized protein YecE (DUF72 family)